MNTPTLLETTLEKLRARGRYREVSEATGLNYDWIAKLVQGHIEDPGVNKVERLHRFLTEEEALRAELKARHSQEARPAPT